MRGFLKTFLPLSLQTPLPLPLPKLSSPAPAPAVKKADDVEWNVNPPAAIAAPKDKPAAGVSKLKLVGPEKNKPTKELKAEKKELGLG